MAVIIALFLLMLTGGIYLKMHLLSSGDSNRPDADVLERVVMVKPIRLAGKTILGRAWKERRNGNIILEIAGEPYEMGYQHGALMKEEIVRGVVPLFGDPVGNSKEYGRKPVLLRWLVLKYLDFMVYGPLERNTPKEYLEELKGIADGSGLEYRSVFRATFQSELGMLMTAGVINKKIKELGIAAECSAFAASRSATADGRLIIGRNTDYGGQGRWMAGQTIFLYRPKKGYAYANISTAGLIKCISAMNERGLVIGGHFMTFEGTGPRGLSYTVLQHEIMRKAGGIDDAVTIVRRAPRAGSFGFILAEGKSRDAVVIEANADAMGIRRMKNHSLCITNYAVTAELKRFDLSTRLNIIMRDIGGRYLRLEELIAANYGRITPRNAAEFMGDHIDFITKTERATGIGIGSASNVTSAVFVPEDGLFYVATGSEPACTGPYVAFDFRAWHRGTIARSITPLPGYRWKDRSREKGLRAYMQAFGIYVNNPFDTKNTLKLLDAALSADPKESIYHRVKAVILFHEGSYRDGIALLKNSLRLPQSNNEKAHAHLLMGLGLDITGERMQALEHYRAIAKLHKEYGVDSLRGINALVHGLSMRCRRRPFTKMEIADIPVGFNSKSGLE